jgi:hypothetical protein
MFVIRHVISLSLFAIATTQAAAADFPKAPPNLKEAETQGLHRLNKEELKAFFPGTVDVQGPQGGEKTKTFKPDGTLDIKDFENKTGTWRFDAWRGAYCNRIYRSRKKSGENCFVVLRAADGVHYFDYDIKTGHFAAVWRRSTAQ